MKADGPREQWRIVRIACAAAVRGQRHILFALAVSFIFIGGLPAMGKDAIAIGLFKDAALALGGGIGYSIPSENCTVPNAGNDEPGLFQASAVTALAGNISCPVTADPHLFAESAPNGYAQDHGGAFSQNTARGLSFARTFSGPMRAAPGIFSITGIL